MKPIVKILLDTRRKKNNSEKYPVKLRVTFAKQQKHYPVNIDMTSEEFILVQNPGSITKNATSAVKKELKEWKLKCDAVLVKANHISESLPDFSFPLFEKKMFQTRLSGTDVYLCYKETIDRLRKMKNLVLPTIISAA